MSDVEQNDELFNNLLAAVTLGGDSKDPREGAYALALTYASMGQTSKGGNTLILQFDETTDSEGNPFSPKDIVQMPTGNSHAVSQRIFLRTLHSLGVVPKSHKQLILVEDVDAAAAVVQAVAAKVGVTYSFKVTSDDSGFLRFTYNRT